jgi:hypothetical protein
MDIIGIDYSKWKEMNNRLLVEQGKTFCREINSERKR